MKTTRLNRPVPVLPPVLAPGTFQLRSHESSKNGLDVEAKYTILRDGEPLGFFEHAAAIDRLNAVPDLITALEATTIFLAQAVELGVLDREEVEPMIAANWNALNRARVAA